MIRRTLRDSTTSAAYAWTYAYGTPALNSLGARWGSYGPNYWPNLAALYYNRFVEDWRGDANAVWLVHKAASEFRGHDWVTEYGPDGSAVEHLFYQGQADCGSPTATNGNILGDSCFQELRNREFLKGREYLTWVRAGSGGTLLSETKHAFVTAFMDYGPAPLSGLWRAFSYENGTEDRMFDANGTVRTKSTTYSYETTYGNQTERWTWDGGTVVRKEQTFYATRNDAASYIVNRPWQTTVRNGSDQYVALTAFFYDYGSTTNTLGTRGLLTRTSSASRLG